MPLLRTLTTKLKTAISPSTSPTSSATSSPTSPTSPAVPSFQVVSGRKAGGPLVKRPEQNLRMDSFIMETASQPQKTEYQTSTPEQEQMQDPVPIVSLKRRRTSRFREELDGEHD